VGPVCQRRKTARRAGLSGRAGWAAAKRGAGLASPGAVKVGPGAVEGFGPCAGLMSGPKGKGGVGREGAGWAERKERIGLPWAGLGKKERG
jgi:hypothetical protein